MMNIITYKNLSSNIKKIPHPHFITNCYEKDHFIMWIPFTNYNILAVYG